MNKKILAISLMALLLGCGAQNFTFAESAELKQTSNSTIEANQETPVKEQVISPKLEKELKISIKNYFLII